MKIKLDENGNPVLDENGNPIYIFEEEGQEPTEKAVDVPSLFAKIKNLNRESKDHRLEKNELAGIVKHLQDAGIDDVESFIEEAKANKQAVASFDEKDMKSVDEIEQIKRGVSESYEAKIKELNTVIGDIKSSADNSLKMKDQSIRNLLIKGSFDKSDFIREKTVLTPEIAFNTFGKSFDIEDAEDGSSPTTFAKDSKGDKIYSMANPGEVAGPEEAIELLIKQYPQSDSIMRNSSGGDDGGGPSKNNASGMSNEDFSKLSPSEKLKHVHKTHNTGRK